MHREQCTVSLQQLHLTQFSRKVSREKENQTARNDTVREMMIPGAGQWNLQYICVFTFRNATDWVQQGVETVAV
jgi:hypothetical protein